MSHCAVLDNALRAPSRLAVLSSLRKTIVRPFAPSQPNDTMSLQIVQDPRLFAVLSQSLADAGAGAAVALEILRSLVTGLTFVKLQCKAAFFDDPCFSSAVRIAAATGDSVQLKRQAFTLVVDVSSMATERRKAYLDHPGMAALLQSGLHSANDHFALNATIAVSNLSMDAAAAAAVLDGHPGLVKALVDTFSTAPRAGVWGGGVCSADGKFRRELRTRPLISFLNREDCVGFCPE